MPVYTSFDMIADCRANNPAGWLFFAEKAVPPLQWLYRRYGLGEDAVRARIASLRSHFPEFAPMSLRQFIAALRPETAARESNVAIEDVAAALEPLTVLERQLVWLETMGYDTPEAARLTRMSPETAASIRDKAAELLRGKFDSWTRTMLRDNGASLGAQARRAKPGEPVRFNDYLDILDGRMTWQNRATVDLRLAESWYEVDQFCRVREADAAVMETKPLAGDAAQPYLDLLEVKRPKPGVLGKLWRSA
jgi:hypothetical protein